MIETANYTLRDEIRDYWSDRAATFDDQVGHEIFDEAERRAWHALFLRHLAPGEGQAALDLGCGTGVISCLLEEVGYSVTGMDWAEPMLSRARAKAKSDGRATRFVVGDAERTMLPDASFDAIAARHLVWTLVDPKAAFTEWHRLLRPGGRLLIVDGDFVTPTWLARLRRLLPIATTGASDDRTRIHRSILSRVHFSNGAQATSVASLVEACGFKVESIDFDLRAIHRAQGRRMTPGKRLDRGAQHRYAILGTKPVSKA